MLHINEIFASKGLVRVELTKDDQFILHETTLWVKDMFKHMTDAPELEFVDWYIAFSDRIWPEHAPCYIILSKDDRHTLDNIIPDYTRKWGKGHKFHKMGLALYKKYRRACEQAMKEKD